MANANIYKIIIGFGTFALALAFSGNDLVNFIGVPIAAWQSYEIWIASGIPAHEFSMQGLDAKVPTPTPFLFIAGLIMVLTLWFSSKAKLVVKTSIDLSNQGEIEERFNPNWISRGLVRFAMIISKRLSQDIPNHLKNNASNYLNPHNFHGKWLQQEYLPTDLKGMKFWKPKDSGWEKNKSKDVL